MREITLNGYIAEEAWFEDEIDPIRLHDELYAMGSDPHEDVHITINSYGGSCNAAVRMHDELKNYPGKVNVTISGTAASAATVLVQAADYLEMTSGSLFMIHDPSLMAYGNEHDLNDAINLLKACKQSILNVYSKRCSAPRETVSEMMTNTTWMDAQTAKQTGFIDAVADDAPAEEGVIFNVVRAEKAMAEKLVNAWDDRCKQRRKTPVKPIKDEADKDTTEEEKPVVEPVEAPVSEPETVVVAEQENEEKAVVEDTTNANENKVSAEMYIKRLALLNIQNI